MKIKIKKTSDKEYSYLNLLLLGESGTGKTYFLGTAENDKTLIINVLSESGIFTLRDKNIDCVDVNSYEDIMEVFHWLAKMDHNYLYIGIDSLSQLQKNFEKQFKTSDKFKLWAEIKEKTKEIVDYAKKLPLHTCFITEVKIDRDEEIGTFKVLPSLSGSVKDEIQYYFDIVLFFDKIQEKEGKPITYRALSSSSSKYPCKDRSGKLPLVIENPQWSILSEVIFGKITEDKHKENVAQYIQQEKQEESLINELEMLMDTKEYDNKKLYDIYGLIPDIISKGKVKEVVEILRTKKDKKIIENNPIETMTVEEVNKINKGGE